MVAAPDGPLLDMVVVWRMIPEHQAVRRILGPPPSEAGIEQVSATAMEYHAEPEYVLLSTTYIGQKGGKHYDSHEYEIVFACPEPEMIDIPESPPHNACPHCKENVKQPFAEGQALLDLSPPFAGPYTLPAPGPSECIHTSRYCPTCNRAVCPACEEHPHLVGPNIPYQFVGEATGG